MNDFYENIELTPEELKAAILEGKKKKFFHERSKEYCESQEKSTSPISLRAPTLARIGAKGCTSR